MHLEQEGRKRIKMVPGIRKIVSEALSLSSNTAVPSIYLFPAGQPNINAHDLEKLRSILIRLH
jgi:hypothetical protein